MFSSSLFNGLNNHQCIVVKRHPVDILVRLKIIQHTIQQGS